MSVLLELLKFVPNQSIKSYNSVQELKEMENTVISCEYIHKSRLKTECLKLSIQTVDLMSNDPMLD